MPVKRSTKDKLSQLMEAVSADDVKQIDFPLAAGAQVHGKPKKI